MKRALVKSIISSDVGFFNSLSKYEGETLFS
jgi:hypothetical protein